LPQAGLTLSGNTLYGTAYWGGTYNVGTVFALNTNGSGFTTLHIFSWSEGGTNASGVHTNSDGAWPQAGLILSGNILYGTATGEGSSGTGTMFALNTNGTGFTTLYSFSPGGMDYNFSGNRDGAAPYAGLTLSHDTFYGTAYYGGSAGYGTVFSLSFRPQLTLIRSGLNVILAWPTNVAGFDYSGFRLQSITNLVSMNWSTVSRSPVVVNTNNAMTNALFGGRIFYRLIE
jgi:uncharacterized repeat protein (TIGR03803 family)